MRKPGDLVLLRQRVAWAGWDLNGKKSIFLNTGMDRRFVFGKPTANKIAKWMTRAAEWVGRG